MKESEACSKKSKISRSGSDASGQEGSSSSRGPNPLTETSRMPADHERMSRERHNGDYPGEHRQSGDTETDSGRSHGDLDSILKQLCP